jgi:N-acetyl-gamma-glutamyl-phosphate reductase
MTSGTNSVSPSTPVAIIGPTGYTGLELIELIARHPQMHIAYLGSARTPAPRIDAEFPRLAARLGRGVSPECEPIDHDAIAKRCRLAFLCLPHEAAMEHAPLLLSRGLKVVDLSAAYRLKNVDTYHAAYGHHHTDPANLAHAVYGLPELDRASVRTATLVANPGCYPTACTLALVPLLRAGLLDPTSIIINAASGVSGAGRAPKPNLHFPEANENFSAYGIGVHRHQPEIGQSLRTWGVSNIAGAATAPPIPDPLFVPHLLPVERGILETIYASPRPGVTTESLSACLNAAYAGEPFVVMRDHHDGLAPTLRDVQRTNMVHISARVVAGRIVIVAAEDNLVKGASGQAIQNANLMLNLPETAGLL